MRSRPTSGRSNLPRPLTRLVGRERELEGVAGLLVDPDVRIITVTGPGGVGKTRLLLELARRHEAEYADGAVFVRLEQLTDPALVAAEIASALSQRDGTDGPSADDLSSDLRDRELLLAVDNFEHLLAASVLIAELLALAPRLRVLVSSRTALRIRGEQVFELEPLELPAGDTEEAVAHSPAVQMFLQCALAANRRLEVDTATARTVAKICRAIDGLPLAIELAASRSQSLSASEIADQLAEPLSIGERALRDLPDRQQTLQGTIRWSYDLLAAGAQELLRAAAVFLGGFTAAALESVVRRPVRADLEELLAASLARRGIGSGRFELLELVRAFALEELATGGEAPDARARHRRHFAAGVSSASTAFDNGGSPGEIAAPLLADHANIRAALEDAIEAGDEQCAISVALGLRPVWLSGMLRQESQELVDRLLRRFSIPGETEVSIVRAVAFLDYSPTAKTWHRRLADRAAEIGDTEALALATGNLFGQALNARDRDEMARLRPSLLALITPQTSDKALGWIHYFLALDAYVGSRLEDACEQASLSAEKAQAVGHEFMLASASGTWLLAKTALEGVISQPAVAKTVELMRRPGVPPLSACGLWLAARYAVSIDPAAAGRWLAHAERIVATLDSELWPESVIRDETLEVLGIGDLAPLLERTPQVDHAAALAEAAEWLAARDRTEVVPREAGATIPS